MKSFTGVARWSAVLLALGGIAACGNQNSSTSLPQAGATPAPSASTSPEARSLAVSVSIPQGAVDLGAAAFGTNPLVVEQGATVTWTNNDTVAHTVTAEDGTFGSDTIEPGETFEYTFDQPGTFNYFCAIHGAASMSGVVQVNANGSSPTPEPAPSEAPDTSDGGGYLR